jgi:hypothetical protein
MDFCPTVKNFAPPQAHTPMRLNFDKILYRWFSLFRRLPMDLSLDMDIPLTSEYEPWAYIRLYVFL